jgi:hypothetical protein
MATFSANEIIGKTLIAKRPIDLYRAANDSAQIIYTVEPGQTVGKVYSYLAPGAQRSVLYWAFYDETGRPYYSKHKTGNYDISSLSEQGALTVQEQAEQAAEAELTTGDKILRLIKNIALIAAGAYLLNTIVKKKI